jgi:plasmid replication initiation protein
MATILTEKYEINKPSSLTQIVYYDPSSKELTSVNSLQIDLVNSMYYMVNKVMHSKLMDKESKDRILNCEQDDVGSETFEIRLKDISRMLGKYSNSQYDYIINKIHHLRHVDVIVNALNKDKEMTRTTASVVGPINEIMGNNVSFKAAFPRVLVKSYFNTQKYFKKHYLAIQFSLKSKYSKLLYELAKDYEGLEHGITLDIDSLIELLNVTTDSMKAPSRFKAHVLKRSVEEINRETDIIIEYVMEKDKNKVYKVNIKSYKQNEDRLKELGLIEPPIENDELYHLSFNKLEKLKAKGYDVKDDDAWIKTDLKNNKENYESMNKIDEFLQDNDETTKNEFYQNLAKYVKSNDPIVVINEYIIKDIYSGTLYSKNATETHELMVSCFDEYYD